MARSAGHGRGTVVRGRDWEDKPSGRHERQGWSQTWVSALAPLLKLEACDDKTEPCARAKGRQATRANDTASICGVQPRGRDR